jgi:hypothetical protein
MKNMLKIQGETRGPDWSDFAITSAATLAACAASGATLILLTNFAERLLAGPGPTNVALATIWVYAIGLMNSPFLGWRLYAPAIGLWIILRKLGYDGLVVAMIIGGGLTALATAWSQAGLGDTLITIAIGVTHTIFFWLILRWRCENITQGSGR